MLSITHGLTGAFIATKIENPLISIPLILAAHYLQDYIPHFDTGTGITKHLKTKRTAFLQELFLDFPLSIVSVYFFFTQYQGLTLLPWLGWFVALCPDFIEFPFLFLNWRFFPIKELAKVHALVHRSIQNKFLGLLPQIIIVILIYLFSR